MPQVGQYRAAESKSAHGEQRGRACHAEHGRHLNKTNGPLPSRQSDVSSLDADLPPLLSPDSSIASEFNSLDTTESNPTQDLVQNGLQPSISEAGNRTFPGDASGTDTIPLDLTINPSDDTFLEALHDFPGEDNFLVDFEAFTQLPSLYVPDVHSHNATPANRTYTSPLSWVANWCEHDNGQHARLKPTNISLAPETIESLLRDYFQFANPSFPVVSEWDLYRLTHPNDIEGGEQIPPMSLALFNAIMFAGSAFATIEVAQGAGFSDIRAMRDAFHARAAYHYEARCERDLLNQIRICLLLSQRRKYPDGMFENEKWTLRAQHLLQKTEKLPLISDNQSQGGKSSRWKVLQCCCLVRAQRVLIGTHRNASVTTTQIEPPCITIMDLEDDLRFSWFLTATIKEKLAQVFVASVDLHRSLAPLCPLILRRDSEPGAAQKGTPTFTPFRGSVMGALEEVERSLVEWRARYDGLFLTSDTCPVLPPSLQATAAYVNLCYEYGISYLHQISLDFERSSTTPWAARMRESSREALQISAASTTRILRDLLGQEAVKFLPFSTRSITMLFIPLTINSVFLKSSVQSCKRSVYDLSICFQALEVLAERHEIADFFWELNNALVMLVHEKMAKGDVSPTPLGSGKNSWDKMTSAYDAPEKVPLPQTDTYSSVLKFLRQSFVLGSVQWEVLSH
ncbi:hypothetical protein LTR84_012783 [Exophiala bonariae]|uniref:Transcription factor domain-containing protein n=1 Tax=Exophiala bonariae TaxID=1690606 RepID=A0AAV9NEY7_9EURO|nr:hypothetical protein LTR84_012783 [Exophiala bonariae]